MDMQNGVVIPNVEQPTPKKSRNLILIILLVVLLLGNGVTLYFLLKKPVSVAENNNVALTNEDANTDTATTTDIQVVIDDEFKGLKPLQVTWQKPTIMEFASLLSNYNDLMTGAKKLATDNDNWLFSEYMRNVKLYKVGVIQNMVNMDGNMVAGEYNAAELFIVTALPDGPIGRSNFYRVIKYNNTLFLLDKQSDSLNYNKYLQVFISNHIIDYYLANLETPNEIKIPNSSAVLVKDKEELMMLKEDFGDMTKITDDIYFGRDCYLVIAPDGSVRVYYLKADIFNKLGSLTAGRTQDVLNIIWNNGSANTVEYGPIAGPLGCGGPGCYDVAEYITNVNMLNIVGKTTSGSPIYELKDVNTKARADDQVSVLQNIYDSYYPGYNEEKKTENSKLSFSNFLADHPLIFWQDPFGKFIAFTNAKYAPVAECGKPVIYLYPSKTTDISVKVNPTGGFTKTEPAHGNGWQVKAEPNGNLYNYQDQKNYPYLFWEGYALNYQMSDEGFVVAKQDVNKFLREKLAIQGLNDKEINDFVEFWLPRMQNDPYYFVTFVPQAEFDQMAPLTVSPRPDTVIRVFMDFQALDKPIQVKEQKLTTPKRIGFTVVEWGGEMQK